MPTVSVFTPTHKPDYLFEAYQSLCEQTLQDFEWVLVPNGPEAKVVDPILRDQRVRVLPCDDSRIGALKAHAVAGCRGDLLVELDHDDLLTPTCLARLAAAAPAGGRPAFLYSDCVNFNPDRSSEVFDSFFGWATYPFQWRNLDYTALRSFPATARSLAEVEFCPNHVRAWTRSAYEMAGGYNRLLPVGDDHELLCRTYLAGVPFIYLPEVLYLYRRHAGNSFLRADLNEAIHQQSLATMNAHLHRLVAEWCRREGLLMIDLGGAHRHPPGYTPLDRDLPAKIPGIKADVLEEAVWEEHLRPGRVGAFRAVDFMEHVPSCKVPWLMNHLWEALAHGGWLLTETPAVSDNEGRVGWGAFRDPTHVSFWCPDNWRYYTEGDLARFVPEVRCKFQEVRIWLDYPSGHHQAARCPYLFADLCASHGGRLPGGLRI